MDERIKKELMSISRTYGGEVFFDYPLKELGTMKTGGNAEALYMPGSIKELIEVRTYIRAESGQIRVIGRGSNILFPSGRVKGLLMLLNKAIFQDIRFSGKSVTAGCGVKMERLIAECVKKGLSGFEGLVGVPASIGGAIKMNAGYKEEISRRVKKVLVLDEADKEKWIEKENISFGYRSASFPENTLILAAEFELEETPKEIIEKRLTDFFREKMDKQPLGKNTLGCIFKNPYSTEKTAGELIELSRMKGVRSGGAVVSGKHANFIVNDRGATTEDIVGLIEKIKSRVRDEFSVSLETEIEIWQ